MAGGRNRGFIYCYNLPFYQDPKITEQLALNRLAPFVDGVKVILPDGELQNNAFFGHNYIFESDKYVIFINGFFNGSMNGGRVMAELTVLQMAAALCEEAYRRADNTSSSKYNEGFGDRAPINKELSQSTLAVLQAKGFTLDNGFYYNNVTGFVGQIIEANGKIFVVFRGSDLSGGLLDTARLNPAATH